LILLVIDISLNYFSLPIITLNFTTLTYQLNNFYDLIKKSSKIKSTLKHHTKKLGE